MKVLLDTHVLLWAAENSARLGDGRQLLEAAGQRLLSAVCVWEMAIKQSLGKLSLGEDVGSWTRRASRALQLTPLPVTGDHAAGVEALPALHRDPFDRLLVVQARAEGAVLLTLDAGLARYGDAVRVLT